MMRKIENSILPDRVLFHADALELLGRLPSAKVQLVYIDPPFFEAFRDVTPRNTFTDYLNFLARCCNQAMRVLSETGNLVLHFNPYHLPYARVILDEIFGQDNFKNEFIVPTPKFGEPEGPTFDVFVVYQRSERSIYNHLYLPYDQDELRRLFPYEEKGKLYRLVSLVTSTNHPRHRFEWNGIIPPEDRSWRFTQEKMDELLRAGRISFNLSKTIPSLKQYASEAKGKPLGSIWNDLPRFLPSEERTGYPSQQPLDLLWRIIRICSQKGDVVCDPFCGSGTSLIAAEFEGRKWIGCDNLKEAVDLTLSRLRRHFRISDSSIMLGNKRNIAELFGNPHLLPDVKVIQSIERPLRLGLTQKRRNKVLKSNLPQPLIITEGKTDWKHIKAAYQKLRDVGYIRFDVDFHQFEEARGDSYTLDMCKKQALIKNPEPRIFVFDRDVANIVKDVNDDTTGHRDWGNNVYSFALPLPQHRRDTPEISIEFYYQDADLTRKDSNGRRLFLSNEFNPKSGRHLTESLNCTDLKKLRGQSIKIIDDQVFDDLSNNVALPKDKFADYVSRGEQNFNTLDILAFIEIFKVIAEIMAYPEEAISIPMETKKSRRKTVKKQ